MTDCLAVLDFELRTMAWELARAVLAAELARRRGSSPPAPARAVARRSAAKAARARAARPVQAERAVDVLASARVVEADPAAAIRSLEAVPARSVEAPSDRVDDAPVLSIAADAVPGYSRMTTSVGIEASPG